MRPADIGDLIYLPPKVDDHHTGKIIGVDHTPPFNRAQVTQFTIRPRYGLCYHASQQEINEWAKSAPKDWVPDDTNWWEVSDETDVDAVT